MPAGAFHTPRCASVRAITPAIMPLAGNVSIWPSSIGSACLMRGKNTARVARGIAVQVHAGHAGLRAADRVPAGLRIDDQKRPAPGAQARAHPDTRRPARRRRGVGQDAQEIEEIGLLEQRHARLELGGADGGAVHRFGRGRALRRSGLGRVGPHVGVGESAGAGRGRRVRLAAPASIESGSIRSSARDRHVARFPSS